MSKKTEEYPALKEEVEKKKQMVALKYVDESEAKEIEAEIEKEDEIEEQLKSMPDPYRFAGYNPDVIDFIRRCDTEEQALEIISYLESKGELSSDEADNYKTQLHKKGIRSFGEKKQQGFYFQRDED